jgi:hypothetical protein
VYKPQEVGEGFGVIDWFSARVRGGYMYLMGRCKDFVYMKGVGWTMSEILREARSLGDLS